ncbi:MAG: ligase-associated DNA damage response exonuclease [Bacteroidetes bacterium]|nr:ligase-associated DNA damage response exonuclease [Bacteroidota bacterium]
MGKSLLQFTKKGIYCSQAKVYIDPWRPVDKAIVTHAHADHSRKGMKHYLTHHYSIPIMKARLGKNIVTQGLHYGEEITINEVKFSLHPAGHVVGSAQVRVEYNGEVWVVSGDYKTQDDGLSTPFEPVKCHTFITECTFGLPVFLWQPQHHVISSIEEWWQNNQSQNRCSLISAYSLGKAQRILYNLAPLGPIYVHSSVDQMNKAIEESGIRLKNKYQPITKHLSKADFEKALIISPGTTGDNWTKLLGKFNTAACSGWMQLRGMKRRQNLDTGFVLSDHADWQGLNQAIKCTTAENIICTHGYSDIFSAWLREQGLNAHTEQTLFQGEE